MYLCFMSSKHLPIRFAKYQATGNDFIIIDNRKDIFKSDREFIEQLCHRRFGIGADGLILLENDEKYDFKMVYFNADGAESSMCGNGGRSIVHFAKHLGIVEESTEFLAIDGPHKAFIQDGTVRLKMKDTFIKESNENHAVIDTGSPHYVIFKDHVKDIDVKAEGAKIRYSDRFSEKGINVNFVETISEQELFVRTYERGVEDETYSCGTGVTAASLVWGSKKGFSPIFVHTPGGKLEVHFQYHERFFTEVYLSGPAIQVFQGEFLEK